jgi:hypothetical protein
VIAVVFDLWPLMHIDDVFECEVVQAESSPDRLDQFRVRQTDDIDPQDRLCGFRRVREFGWLAIALLDDPVCIVEKVVNR